MTDLVPVDPRRAALLLMDFQQGPLAPIPDVAILLSRVGQARAAAASAGVEVIHVRVALTSEQRAAVPASNKAFAAIAARAYLGTDSSEAAFHPAAVPEPGEHVVTKIRVGALSTTGLDGCLRQRGIDTLILAGVHTSGVVLSTVRDAADRDYRLLVLADCVADPTPEVHETLMTGVFPRQADIVDTDTLRALLGDGRLGQ